MKNLHNINLDLVSKSDDKYAILYIKKTFEKAKVKFIKGFIYYQLTPTNKWRALGYPHEFQKCVDFGIERYKLSEFDPSNIEYTWGNDKLGEVSING